MSEITLAQLTESKLDGKGVFDVLLQTLKLHLDTQYNDNRITGPEYAQVYLSQVQSAMQTGLTFLAQQQRIGLEADLLAKQIELAEAQLAISQAQLLQTQAQTALFEAQTAMTQQQKDNAVLEGKVLIAQECKLRAEYDFTLQNTLRTTAETSLVNQKVITEKAQVLSLGVDDNSVIGKQKGLYQAQTDGFKRDAEQKVAKMYVDVWSAMRMTDDATPASIDNGLDAATMGRVMANLRSGVGIQEP